MYMRGEAGGSDYDDATLAVTLSSHPSVDAGRRVDALASGRVKDQRLKSARGQDIAIFVEMDDGGGDVFLSGRVSPRLPASRARVTFRLSLTDEQRWVAKNGEWLYESMVWAEPLALGANQPRRRAGRRVEGVVSTRKPSSACCWITTGDLMGGVYCLSKWCPGGRSPPLGTIVSFELKQGKYGDWRVAHPPGLTVVGNESLLLERTFLQGSSPVSSPGVGPRQPSRAPSLPVSLSLHSTPPATPTLSAASAHSFDGTARSGHSFDGRGPVAGGSVASARSFDGTARSYGSQRSYPSVPSLPPRPPQRAATWGPPEASPEGEATRSVLDNISSNLSMLLGRVNVSEVPPGPPRATPRVGPVIIDDSAAAPPRRPFALPRPRVPYGRTPRNPSTARPASAAARGGWLPRPLSPPSARSSWTPDAGGPMLPDPRGGQPPAPAPVPAPASAVNWQPDHRAPEWQPSPPAQFRGL